MAALAAADPRVVTLETADGSRIAGTIDLAEFRLETSLGEISFPAGDVDSIEFSGGRATVRTRDGASASGTLQLELWKVRTERLGALEVRTSNLVRAQFRVLAAAGPNAGDLPPVPGARAVWKLGGSLLGGLAAGTDPGSVWICDAAGSRAIRFSRDPLKETASVKLPQPPECWAVSPDGRRAVASHGRNIVVLDLELARVVEEATLKTAPGSLCLMDSDLLLATLTPSPMALVAFRLGPLEPLAMCGLSSDVITRVPGKPAVIAGIWTVEVLRSADGRGVEFLVHTREPREGTEPALWAPAEDVIVPRSGALVRIPRSHLARPTTVRPPVGQGATACAFLTGAREILVFHADAVVRRWDPETFRSLGESTVGVAVYGLVADEARGEMMVFGTAPGAMRAPGFGTRNSSPPGDILILPLPR